MEERSGGKGGVGARYACGNQRAPAAALAAAAAALAAAAAQPLCRQSTSTQKPPLPAAPCLPLPRTSAALRRCRTSRYDEGSSIIYTSAAGG